MILSYSEYGSKVSSLCELEMTQLAPDDQRSWYAVWVPITWGDSPRTEDISEADDWKDVFIPAASLWEAEQIANDAFGVEAGATVEPADSEVWI